MRADPRPLGIFIFSSFCSLPYFSGVRLRHAWRHRFRTQVSPSCQPRNLDSPGSAPVVCGLFIHAHTQSSGPGVPDAKRHELQTPCHESGDAGGMTGTVGLSGHGGHLDSAVIHSCATVYVAMSRPSRQAPESSPCRFRSTDRMMNDSMLGPCRVCALAKDDSKRVCHMSPAQAGRKNKRARR